VKRFITATIAAGALATAALGLAGTAAAAGTSGSTGANAQTTIDQLSSSGYHVVTERAGNAPIGQCTVASVNPGQTYSHTDHSVPGDGSHLNTTTSAKTLYVNLDC